MYLVKELTDASLPEIGRAFGGKHHTTVIHSINKIEKERQARPGIEQAPSQSNGLIAMSFRFFPQRRSNSSLEICARIAAELVFAFSLRISVSTTWRGEKWLNLV